MRTQKPSVRIDDWSVVASPIAGGYRELRPGNLLVGRVFGHPAIQEGAFVFSSPVVHVDRQLQIIETKNTAYTLGKMSVEYGAWSREHEVAA